MVEYKNCKVNDIVVLMDNCGVILTGIIVEKNYNAAGNYIRVRVGYDNPKTIYIDNKSVQPIYDVCRVVGNLWEM